MRISLDYDGTYTRDPKRWDAFVKLMQDGGHEVVCVTMRYPTETVEIPNVETIYTSREGKLFVCARRGISIDVWIDDMPKLITMDAAI